MPTHILFCNGTCDASPHQFKTPGEAFAPALQGKRATNWPAPCSMACYKAKLCLQNLANWSPGRAATARCVLHVAAAAAAAAGTPGLSSLVRAASRDGSQADY